MGRGGGKGGELEGGKGGELEGEKRGGQIGGEENFTGQKSFLTALLTHPPQTCKVLNT
jgi:hypothetical protein